MSHDHFCVLTPPHESYGNITVIQAYMMWAVSHGFFILHRHRSDFCCSGAHCQPISSRCAGLTPASPSCCVRARACVCNTRPPPHTRTNKIKCRSRAVSFQSVTALYLSSCPLALKASLSSCRTLTALDGPEEDECWRRPRGPPAQVREEARSGRRPAEPVGGVVSAGHSLRLLERREAGE